MQEKMGLWHDAIYKFLQYKQIDDETVTEFSLRLHALFGKAIERHANRDMQIMSQTLLKEQFVEQLSDNIIRRLAKEHLVSNPNFSFVNIRDFVVKWQKRGPKISLSNKTELTKDKSDKEGI